MASRRSIARLFTVAAIAGLLVLATASTAFAATGEPVLGLAALQAKLVASPSGSVTGYMKTVLHGSTIETIPVEVLAVDGDSPSSSLILFQASGSKIDAIGGIAAGMSGSPIYVEDDGVWKVVGAVSYGDYFTLSGTGLATPIESMLQLLTDYAPRASRLAEPVLVSGKLIDRVVISDSPAGLDAAGATGAFVARPLSSFFIGGLRPGSKSYEKLVALFAKNHVTVTPIGSRLSAGASSFSTELVPGAAVGALATRGDMWVGGIGTVTYTDGDQVLAYGHPSFWTGSTDLYMANAWISGIWPSSYEPYKMGFPASIQGAFTQDRNAGIMGTIGATTVEVPVTARVMNRDSGTAGTSSVWISSRVLEMISFSGIAAGAVSVAGYKAFDQDMIPGSAVTTTTVVVSSGGKEYTAVMRNIYDDDLDIVEAMTEDADWAAYRLASVLREGVEKPHIVSMNLEASASSSHQDARIVGVNALAPLHSGDNAVRVSFLAYGIAATQTIDTTVTIPEDAALTGELMASCLNSSSEGDDAPAARDTVAGVVDELNTFPPYSEFSVAFVPSNDSSGGEPESIEATAASPWYLNGSAVAEVTEIDAYASSITYGNDAYVTGEVSGPTSPVEVSVYGLDSGGDNETLLATGTAEWVDGTLTFEIPVSGLTRSSELRVAVAGGSGYTPAETFIDVTVRGRVRLGATPKSAWRGSWVMLSAKVTPRAASGTVKFQYYDAHAKKWRTLITKRLVRAGTIARAVCWWRPARGTWKVRAVYSGDRDLAGNKSSLVTIKVR